MDDNKLLAVDLFSGAGGLSLGFLQTGQVKIAAAVENNESAQKSYKRNHDRHKHENYGRNIRYFKDIREVNYQEIIDEYRKIDLVFGGPPCQGFSNANRQKSELISTNNQLVKEYVRAIKELNPDAFVMENVKAMKSDKHKFFYSLKDYQEVVEELGIELKPNKVILGKQNSLTDELVFFLRSCIQRKIDLSPYIINEKNLFSKISHISRKEKEAHIYIAKAQSALQKALLKWKGQHNSYWSIEYEEQWMKLGDLIMRNNLTDSSRKDLFNTLNQIIEVQKILMKMNEIQANDIQIVDILLDHKNVCVKVQTYSVMNYLTSKFNSLGYVINKEHIINAAHFGTPQLRERLVLIGVKKEFVGDKPVVLPDSIIKDPDQFYKVEDAIEDLEEIEPFTAVDTDRPIDKSQPKNNNPLLQYLRGTSDKVQNHVMTETTSTALERFKVLEPGQNFHDLDESYKQTYSNPGRTQNTVYLRLNYKTPSGTVLNVRKSMWIHPSKNRAISIREAARLQTFPDDFVFEGSKDSQYQQIGNAVPPLLGRAVAEQVLKYLGIDTEYKLKNIILPQETFATV
ncbi:DNA cytosine methyltransferase [Paenibacillus larvae subsp. pulvifaciens]|uniref:DNA (cytosine-5-)-methyltransferase n=1 Tax=Paenibacillus larvae subsp. pulvifaciens TaxID=1477 RepID=A0A1V0UP64_9BACL|nr:DNA cytosine methyltransferase [Paenibacillus larvae]ARF66921.1 DNA cytosine methyltransferase [Paenibacillus larvae subsp. pulvifaciens]